MKKRSKQMQYYVAYERDGRGGYIASAPSIPGCVVYGKTLKGAHQNISAAIEECLEVIQQFQKSVPRETLNPEAMRKFSFVGVEVYEHAQA